MPILSVFFGIIVRMRHDDHPPPHIHVEYQGFEALVAIQTGEISEGRLPRKAAAVGKNGACDTKMSCMPIGSARAAF